MNDHDEHSGKPESSCDSPGCGCGGSGGAGISRRAFLASTGLVLAGAQVQRAVAGPFTAEDTASFPIPADKKLDAAWVRSLYERGGPTVYRSKNGELGKIGMPVGGIGTGQLYLGGDGKLWLWDIFNLPAPEDFRSGAGPHYAKPVDPASPIEQGFAIRVTAGGRTQVRALDHTGFADITFSGSYPMGHVEYRDPDAPVRVQLTAFSPFIPLNEDDSSLPATIMQYIVKNTGKEEIEIEVAGWLQNGVCLASGVPGRGSRINQIRREGRLAILECSAQASPPASRPADAPRADIVFEDFEKPAYEGWTVTGTAFGSGPIERSRMPAYQGDVNAHGERLVNTHNTRGGEDVPKGDVHVGTLTSREFVIERDFIVFRIGGGNHPGQTCLNLLVDGTVVLTATGRNDNRMRIEQFDVRGLAGRKARIEIVDNVTGGWGNIGVDEIVFTDRPHVQPVAMEQEPDFGTLSIALLDDSDQGFVRTTIADGRLPAVAFAETAAAERTERPFGQRLVGAVGGRATLKPGDSTGFMFVIAWHFDGLWWDSLSFLPNVRSLRRWYRTRFDDATQVVKYIAANFARLHGLSFQWSSTWYNSTLPSWLLNRALTNISTLATATCLRFDNGRFYGWEGTYCCGGTCTHVWQYAQAVARLFPRLERSVREMVDFGLAFDDSTGLIRYRAEAGKELAVDGQAGTILRAYREHQMSPDDGFLRKVWPRVRKAIELLISRDEQGDGLLDGPQYNTLDAAWYGQIAWISSLYLAAVKAGEAMAREMGDTAFAERCRGIVEKGGRSMVDRLFNGEYFIQIPDAAKPEANSTGNGCHIDQLLGQSWAHQVGLGRIVPLEQSRSALRSLWRYNFAPDVGPYRAAMTGRIRGGRWYAMPGEGGLIMCTWPKGGAESATGKGAEAGFAGYFNECMTGFEYQVAGHMIWEGLVEEGLAVTRMIHDRYHASKRNPFNEVECSDHYARAMASYGVFLAVCGYEYHGPRGHLGFAPRLTPELFRAAFTTSEGWGTFEQTRKADSQEELISLHYGRLRLRTLAFEVAQDFKVKTVTVVNVDRTAAAAFSQEGDRVVVRLADEALLTAPAEFGVTFRR